MDWGRSWSDHETGFRGGRVRCGNFEKEVKIQGCISICLAIIVDLCL